MYPVMSATERTKSTLGPVPELPVEKDNRATSAWPNKACADAAEARAISDNCSASGDTFTAQSANMNCRPSAICIRKNDDGVVTPSAKPIANDAASITRRVGLSAPATMTSASPAATMAAPRYSGFCSMRRAIASFTPRPSTKAAICASLGSDKPSGTHMLSSFNRDTAAATRASSISGNTTRFGFAFALAKKISNFDMYASVHNERNA